MAIWLSELEGEARQSRFGRPIRATHPADPSGIWPRIIKRLVRSTGTPMAMAD